MSEGMSVRALAKMMAVSPTTVMSDRKRSAGYAPDEEGRIAVGRVMGLDGKVRPSRRFDTTERDREILAMRSSGATFAEIAAAVGCSVGTAHRVVRSLRGTLGG